jgi:hypothetical protein
MVPVIKELESSHHQNPIHTINCVAADPESAAELHRCRSTIGSEIIPF